MEAEGAGEPDSPPSAPDPRWGGRKEAAAAEAGGGARGGRCRQGRGGVEEGLAGARRRGAARRERGGRERGWGLEVGKKPTCGSMWLVLDIENE